MIATALERAFKSLLAGWRGLSLDAKVIGGLAVANALLLVANHTTVQATSDGPLWRLFPGWTGVGYLGLCLVLALAYPLRDRLPGFTGRQRVLHFIAIIAVMVVLPTIASIILRETGRPYTYVHDGALMIEEASRKVLAGQNPYVADYLDTPLFYWPLVNNPALYHLTYFPVLFLVTIPFVWLFDQLNAFWDQRYLYLPAYLATLAVVPLIVRGLPKRLALTALIALNPQLFPFVVEGRNDFFVLLFVFVGIALLQRDRRTLGVLAVSMAAAAKLHALFLLPFVALYLLAKARPASLREAVFDGFRVWWPSLLLLFATFGPFLVDDFAAFYDDLVRYNAGGAAWSYPISGMGFSALLLALGVIPNPQADFPFAAIEIAVALPIALWWSVRIWRDPTIPTVLAGYAMTLLAFLFFGRYFQGNYLGYIAAIATPLLFLRTKTPRTAARPRPSRAPQLRVAK